MSLLIKLFSGNSEYGKTEENNNLPTSSTLWNETYFMNATMMRSPTPSTTAGLIRCLNSCDQQEFRISLCIITLGVIAVLENALLLVAVATMKLGTKSKMLAFLWHFSLADTIIAFIFVFYHCRTIMSCPKFYTCDLAYVTEVYVVQTTFISSLLASYFFVLATTIDTLIAVRWPLSYSTVVTTRRVRVTSAILWLVTLVVAVVGVCLMTFWDRLKGESILTFIVSFICILTAGLVVGINVAIIVSAWISINRGQVPTIRHDSSRNQRVFPAIDRVERDIASSGGEVTDQRINQIQEDTVRTISRTVSNGSGIFVASYRLSERQKQNRKLTVTLVMFVTAFLVSCIPWPTTLLICNDVKACQIKQSDVYILVLVLLHAIIVPIIYGFRIEEVNQRLKTICFTLVRCKHNTNVISQRESFRAL